MPRASPLNTASSTTGEVEYDLTVMESTEANTSNESNHDSATRNTKININPFRDTKKQQFNTKQRMDMYAFCVLELELHGNTVSIKKKQQAIQKALKKDGGNDASPNKDSLANPQGSGGVVVGQPNRHHHQPVQVIQKPQLAIENYAGESQHDMNTSSYTMPPNNPPDSLNPFTTQLGLLSPQQHQQHPQEQMQQLPDEDPSYSIELPQNGQPSNHHGPTSMEVPVCNGVDLSNFSAISDEKTLLQLQQEIAVNQRCYSDHQKTQVLTSSMLRDVQKRFAKYYPDTPTPSRTTIKHVFWKCIENGTVENVRNPRKPKKIPNGDQIQDFLLHEPQMSLRQMAKKMNVSTGTVSRRCKALGIIPESVTLKQQQMATARRQKQIKQRENKMKPVEGKRVNANSRQQVASNGH